MESPRVFSVMKRRIRVLRRGKVGYLHRWYVTLDFNGVMKKLAVSHETALWIQGYRL